MSDNHTFVPAPAEGPFTRDAHMFASQWGAVIPLVAWADACLPDLPPAADFCAANYRAMDLAADGGIPVDPEEVARACEALFGPPRPAGGRGYPRTADWVVTTPMEGVFLTVDLEGDECVRFGLGIDKSLPGPEGQGAYLLREIRIQRALGAAMAPIREAIEASRTPSPY